MINYNLFGKNRLYQATIIGLLLPFAIFILTSITSYYLYGITIPWAYISLSSLPMLGLFINVKLQTADTWLVVSYHFLSLTLLVKRFEKTTDQEVKWVSSKKNKHLFMLYVGDTFTKISVHG